MFIVATLLRLDVLMTNAELRSQEDLMSLATRLRAIILLKQHTTPKTILLHQATSHQCSRVPTPYPALLMTSPNPRLHPRRSAPRLSQLPLHAQLLRRRQSPREPLGKWMLTKTMMIAQRRKRKDRPAWPMDQGPRRQQKT